MKRLVLFIFVLFGILSVQSVAGGCNAQICICPNGGYVYTNQYCPVSNNTNYGEEKIYYPGNYYILVSPSINSKDCHLINLNRKDPSLAGTKTADYGISSKLYGSQIFTTFDSKGYTAWAISENNKLFWAQESKEGAEIKTAKKRCKKAGNKKCEIILKLDNRNLKLTDLRDNTTTQLKVTYSF